MQFFIIISSVLLFLFYLGLHEGLKDGGSIIGPYLFIIASIFGILIAFFFPLDEGGEMTTWRGKMHLILVILMGILTVAGMIASGETIINDIACINKSYPSFYDDMKQLKAYIMVTR